MRGLFYFIPTELAKGLAKAFRMVGMQWLQILAFNSAALDVDVTLERTLLPLESPGSTPKRPLSIGSDLR